MKERGINMRNIVAVKNEEGKVCLRIMKSTSVDELKMLCDMIVEVLILDGFYDVIVSFNISDSFLSIEINVFDEDYCNIGMVEFISGKGICADETKTEYYDLFPNVVSVCDCDEWLQDNWEDSSNKIIKNLIEMFK